MTKTHMINEVSEKSGLQKREVKKFLDVVVFSIQESLKRGEKTPLSGLGVFLVTDKKARMGRNPRTGEQVPVPAKKAVKFRASKELKELVK